MKAYVVHYSKNRQRRLDLEADPRFQILSDVTWIDWYDREEPECDWAKSLCRSNLNLSLVSNSLKHFEALRLFVESGAPEMVLLEDDVVFQADWLEKLNKIEKPEFVRLDCLLSFKYTGELIRVTDWWPSEAQYFTRGFAQFVLQQISFDFAYDEYIYSLMRNTGRPIWMLPLCNQTSLVNEQTSIEKQDMQFDPPAYYNYWDLHEQLKSYRRHKIDLDQKFLEKYGRKVDIRSIRYLQKNDLE